MLTVKEGFTTRTSHRVKYLQRLSAVFISSNFLNNQSHKDELAR